MRVLSHDWLFFIVRYGTFPCSYDVDLYFFISYVLIARGDGRSLGAIEQVTNDIFTREDAEFLTKNSALEEGR